jgi:hypothetical protein
MDENNPQSNLQSVIGKLKQNRFVYGIVLLLIFWGFIKFIFYEIGCILELGFLNRYFSPSSCSTWWIWEYDLVIAVVGVTIFGIYYLYQVNKNNKDER